MTKHITNTISQQFHRFAAHPFPGWFQRIVNRGYVRIMGLDMSEFDAPEHYATLNALFTRRLTHDRPYSTNPRDLISPCDAEITACGSLEKELSLQIKGMSYRVGPLLGEHIDDALTACIENGSYVNLYLSPKDYHRYHMPADLTIEKAVHIPGKLYPVNHASLHKRSNLFIENERVVIQCRTAGGHLLFIVLVGALNVGKMQIAFEPRIQTNADASQPTVYTFENLQMKKGEDFGCFEMGSTIVLIAEKEAMEIFRVAGIHVRFGETIATIS
ncbi:MAG TPA: phosphatidylserine decarboxylase [Sulfuricurvum sp.]|nr:phosphatidylserine decarboxylase [Sulfuricurvum sp.]